MWTGTYCPFGLVCRVSSISHAAPHFRPTAVPSTLQMPDAWYLDLEVTFLQVTAGWMDGGAAGLPSRSSFLRHLYPALHVSLPSAKRNETFKLRLGHYRRRPRLFSPRNHQNARLRRHRGPRAGQMGCWSISSQAGGRGPAVHAIPIDNRHGMVP